MHRGGNVGCSTEIRLLFGVPDLDCIGQAEARIPVSDGISEVLFLCPPLEQTLQLGLPPPKTLRNLIP